MSVANAHQPNTPQLAACPRPKMRRDFALAALLVAITLAVYLQVGGFGFVPIDDNLYVTKEAHIRDGLSAKGIAWAFGTFYDCNWIPLTWISLMVDASLFGSSPGEHHLANVLLHSANVLLVFAVFAKATRNSERSAFVASLFAVHPLHVESVAWIAERKDVLSLFFGLLALYCYVAYSKKPRVARLGLSLVFYLCSLLSKQTLVTLPFVFLLLDYWPLRRVGPQPEPGRFAHFLIEKLPFFALSAVFCIVELLAQVRGHSTRSLAEIPLGTRCLNANLAYAVYLKRALLPFDLAAFYPHPGTSASLVAIGTAFVLLATITWFAIANARRWPFVLVGWFWYLGTLVPMIGVVQVGIQQMADRYAYFPMLGLYLVVAWLIPALLEPGTARARRLPLIATGAVGVYAVIAFLQVGYWRDGVTLMRHTLAVTSDNPYARFLLGDALSSNNQTAQALSEYHHAVSLAPNDPESHFRLGWVYQGLKDYDRAAEQYRESLALDDKIATTHNRLGWILWAQRQYAEAEQEFNQALQLDVTNIEANANLAGLSRARGDYRRSIEYCQRALELDRGLLNYQRLIAFNLRDLGRFDEAITQLQIILAVSPADAEARSELAHIHEIRGDRPDLVGRAN
jgi:protein O-mannosyl-transferase